MRTEKNHWLNDFKARTWEKIKLIHQSSNKKLIAGCFKISPTNIYYQSKQKKKDLKLKDEILEAFKIHPAYAQKVSFLLKS